MLSETKKRILINFGPLKLGGGQNVALNFIYQFLQHMEKTEKYYFVVCKGSKLEQVVKGSSWSNQCISVSPNPLVRILQEIFLVRKYIKNNSISVVYSYFGFGLFGKANKQIIGSADSNLYFPEVDFWATETFLGKIKRFLVDKYRVWGLMQSSGVIFESPSLYERASTVFELKNRKLILPSFDEALDVKQVNLSDKNNKLRVLLLCGWQRNKNILLIPEIASVLKKQNVEAEFVITARADNSSCSNEFFKLISDYKVEDYINCIGPVDKSEIPSLYENVDAVLLLSLLESFSNNIIESWFYQKPLIISDELWATSICNDAAFYVDRGDSSKIADAILKVSNDKELKCKLTKNGLSEFKKYPTIEERFWQEITFLEGNL